MSAPPRPGFISFKVREPIPYPNRWHRDALVQATLEPTVSQIAALGRDVVLPSATEFAFAARIAGSDFILVVSESQTRTTIPGRPIIAMTRRSLEVEPLATTARSIWAHKRFLSDPGDRFRVIEELTDQPQGKAVQDIFRVLESPFLDPVRQIFSMLANGFVVADLNSGFTLATRLRLGPAAIGAEPVRPRDRLIGPAIERPT